MYVKHTKGSTKTFIVFMIPNFCIINIDVFITTSFIHSTKLKNIKQSMSIKFVLDLIEFVMSIALLCNLFEQKITMNFWKIKLEFNNNDNINNKIIAPLKYTQRDNRANHVFFLKIQYNWILHAGSYNNQYISNA